MNDSQGITVKNQQTHLSTNRILFFTAVYVAISFCWIYAPIDIPSALKIAGLVVFLLSLSTFLISDIRKSIKNYTPQQESYFGFASPAEREKFISTWEAFMAKRDAKERQIENQFNPDQIDCYLVNIWNDYADGDETYAYVESSEVPSAVDFKVLNHLMQFAESLDLVKDGRVKLRMTFHDSVVKYPLLVGNREGEFSLYRRWELRISCPNHALLAELVEKLAKAPDFQGKKIDVYSES